MTAIYLLLIVSTAALTEGVERSTSFSFEGAYYIDDNKGYGVSDGGFAPISYDPVEDPGRNLGSGWGSAEIQALLTHRIRVPFLVGSGTLTSGNNVTFSFTAALTPVSARLETRANLTPIAFLGYQMPLALNTVGIPVETEQNLGYVKELSPMDSNGWGSDHVLITLEPVFNFNLLESSSLAVLLQFRRERLYGDPSIFEPYFENRQAEGTYWDFYRIAFSYGLDL